MTTYDTTESSTVTRSVTAEDGSLWEAIGIPQIVAHGRQGAILAFRAAGDPGTEPLRSTITFNSVAAADFAIRTLGEKDLRRRLALARRAAHGV